MSILRKICLMFAVLSLLATAALPAERMDAAGDAQKNEVEAALKEMFAERAHTLIDRNTERLAKYYLTDQANSKNAYRNERNRTDYVNEWASKRAIKLVKSHSSIRIIRLNLDKETAKISLVHSLSVGYVYLNKIVPVQTFGIGTRHFITLKKIDGQWTVYREWYLDPLDENPKTIADGLNGLAPSINPKASSHSGNKYNRDRAVAYANKYAGAAWGAGNNHRYNLKYLDYTGKGGDCTNFASQAIGDPEEGGGLPMRGGWRYFYNSGGTQTWVQTDSFRNFLLHSGYGKLIALGDYNTIVSPSGKYPDGALAQLQPGDLIGYILHRNDTDHFSILVGFDKQGYPLVSSHTADRYRVPFDLGWDKYTKYELIHIRD